MTSDRADRDTEVIHKARAEFCRHGGLLPVKLRASTSMGTLASMAAMVTVSALLR